MKEELTVSANRLAVFDECTCHEAAGALVGNRYQLLLIGSRVFLVLLRGFSGFAGVVLFSGVG